MFTTLLATTAAAYVDPLFPLRQRYAANASANGYQKTTAVGPYPEGFAEEDYHGTEGLISGADTALTISGNVRAYWVQDSNQHSWDTIDFQKLDLRGKSLRWTTDVSKVGCACNAALYLVAMPSKGQGDNSGYCDIQGVGGEYCLEIDLFEGNQKAMQATLHTQQGQVVDGSCNQYGCAVNWGKDDQRFYGAVSSAMIDSRQAFEMDAAFDEDGHMTVRVRQEGSKTWHDYWTPATAGNPSGSGVPEAAAQATKQALSKGVVLTVSLWEAQDDMAWLNGNCNAQYPHCDLRSASVVFSNIRVIGNSPTPTPGPGPRPPPPPPPSSTCSLYPATNCEGHDLAAQEAQSPEECCTLCGDRTGCTAFTHKGRDQWNPPMCYMKTGCPTKTPTDATVTGGEIGGKPTPQTCALTAAKDCDGHDIASAPANTPGECCALCTNRTGCAAFSHKAQDKWTGPMCYMKSACPTQLDADSTLTAGIVNSTAAAKLVESWLY